MATVKRNTMTLDGIPLHINHATKALGDVIRMFESPSPLFNIRQPESSWSLDCIAYPRSEYEARYVYDLLPRIGRCFNLATLGPGDVCAYCGQYNPAGRLSCWSCGGTIERIPFIKPVQFPVAYISYMSQDVLYDMYYDGPRPIELEMVVPDINPDRHLQPLMESGRMETLQHGMKLNGTWLCKFCGASVEKENAPCPTCGGYQLPYTELVKIDRNCVYCGMKVENGLVCKACGAKLTGLTWEMVKGGNNGR